MLLSLFIRGVVIGLVASIPLGPVGVLCVQRTLSKGHRSGFVSGLGAAAADTIFALAAFFSLAFVLGFIRENITLIKVVGGLCVMMVGVYVFSLNPVVQIRRNRAGRTSLWQDFISLFLVTLANPAFILVFIGLFATFGFSEQTLGMGLGTVMIAGVFCGAGGWWLGLTSVVSLLRGRFRPRHLLWINRTAGAVIVLLGAATVLMMFVNTPVDGILQ